MRTRSLLALTLILLLAASAPAAVARYTFQLSENISITYEFDLPKITFTERLSGLLSWNQGPQTQATSVAPRGIISIFENGRLSRQTQSEPIPVVLIPSRFSEHEIQKLSLPNGVRTLRVDSSSTILPRFQGEWIFLDSFDANRTETPLGLRSHSEKLIIPPDFVWNQKYLNEAQALIGAFTTGRPQIVNSTPSDPQEGFKKLESIVRTNALDTFKEPEGDNATNKFIVPNEFDNYLQFNGLTESHSRSQKAVIAVGTIRAFNLAAVLRRDILVSMDYSNGVIEFNNTLAEMIGTLSRTAFLASILGVEPGEFDLSTREGVFEAASYALERRTQSPSRNPFVNRFMAYLPHNTYGQSFWLGWIYSIKNYASSDLRWNATFFSDIANYEHIQKLILHQKYFSVRGSLSGSTSLKAIGRLLEKGGYKVSELDVSNALEHVAKYEGAGGITNFLRNLEALPTDSNTRVLLTADTRIAPDITFESEPRTQEWVYLVRTFRSLADAISGSRNDYELQSRLSRPAALGLCRKLVK
jgi:hypothetical protein